MCPSCKAESQLPTHPLVARRGASSEEARKPLAPVVTGAVNMPPAAHTYPRLLSRGPPVCRASGYNVQDI